jgi:hypothetical protein
MRCRCHALRCVIRCRKMAAVVWTVRRRKRRHTPAVLRTVIRPRRALSMRTVVCVSHTVAHTVMVIVMRQILARPTGSVFCSRQCLRMQHADAARCMRRRRCRRLSTCPFDTMDRAFIAMQQLVRQTGARRINSQQYRRASASRLCAHNVAATSGLACIVSAGVPCWQLH